MTLKGGFKPVSPARFPMPTCLYHAIIGRCGPGLDGDPPRPDLSAGLIPRRPGGLKDGSYLHTLPYRSGCLLCDTSGMRMGDTGCARLLEYYMQHPGTGEILVEDDGVGVGGI